MKRSIDPADAKSIRFFTLAVPFIGRLCANVCTDESLAAPNSNENYNRTRTVAALVRMIVPSN